MELTQIAHVLTQSYASLGGANYADGKCLPSRASVEQLAQSIMNLLFPGYFQSPAINAGDLNRHVRAELENLHLRLAEETGKCLRFANQVEVTAKSREFSDTLLQEIPRVRRLVMGDVTAAYAGDPAARSIEEVIVAYPFVLVVALQRFAHVMHRLGVPLLPRMLTEYAHERTGCDIHPGARLGESCFIDHCTGVVIGETAVVGARVRIYQGVTLGAVSFETDDAGRPVKGVKRHPEVGDDVTIYANATILGGNTRIGARSVIGANVWLRNSLPEDSAVFYNNENIVKRARPRPEGRVYIRDAAPGTANASSENASQVRHEVQGGV